MRDSSIFEEKKNGMLRRILSFLFLLLFPLLIRAQAADEVSLRSPYDAVYTHLKYLQPESYEPGLAARVFPLGDEEKARTLAVKLKQIYDGKGLFVRMEEIPREPDYMDSSVMQHRYVLFPELLPQVYLVKTGDKWVYSSETMAAIPELHRQVYPFGSDLLVNLLPGIGQKKFLGLFLWQYLGLLIFAVAVLLLHWLFTRLIRLIIHRVELRFSSLQSSARILQKIARPLSWLLITLLIVPFLPMLQLPIGINRYLVMFIRALTPFFATLALYRGVDLLSYYLMQVAGKTENKLDDQLVPLVSKALKLLVVLIGVLYILQNLNFNITTLLAGISIGGIALALAAQDTLKNFFGSVMIFLDKPFQIGDRISFNGVDGMVEEVGFRSTRVRTFANSLVYVPNGKLADMVIDNYGLRKYRRFNPTIGITYDTPPALIKKFVEGLDQIIAKHPATRKDSWEVRFNAMSDSSLNILFYTFFDVPDWTSELKAREEILMAIVELAEELGVRFAFPTSTIHVEELPGAGSLSPQYDTDEEILNKKVAAFLSTYKSKVEGGS